MGHLIDVLTALASLGVKFIGFPQQVQANRRAYQLLLPAGLVTGAAAALMVSYLLWVIHGVYHHDPVEYLSQGMGVVLTGWLTVQAVRCNRRAKAAEKWRADEQAACRALWRWAHAEGIMPGPKEILMIRDAAGNAVFFHGPDSWKGDDNPR
jgi:hypothetical protein